MFLPPLWRWQNPSCERLGHTAPHLHLRSKTSKTLWMEGLFAGTGLALLLP